jgi:hypothetical protein
MFRGHFILNKKRGYINNPNNYDWQDILHRIPIDFTELTLYQSLFPEFLAGEKRVIA